MPGKSVKRVTVWLWESNRKDQKPVWLDIDLVNPSDGRVRVKSSYISLEQARRLGRHLNTSVPVVGGVFRPFLSGFGWVWCYRRAWL